MTEDAPEDLAWYRLHCVFSRTTPTGTIEDKELVTFDLINFTDDAIDSSWITADFTTAEARFDTFWTALKPLVADDVTLVEYRWYERRFAEVMTPSHRFEDSGPPKRITTKSIAGTSTALRLPDQVAISITERTPWPKHWGRFYVPGVTSTVLDNAYPGRIHPLSVAAYKDAATALMNGLFDDELPLVVPVTQAEKQLTKGWALVNAIQVDDVFDIIRSRRAKQPTVRSVGLMS